MVSCDVSQFSICNISNAPLIPAPIPFPHPSTTIHHHQTHHPHTPHTTPTVSDGVVQSITSSHRPVAPREKMCAERDFLRARAGTPSIQTMLPTIWSEARERGFEVADLADWLCASPAHSMGLEGIKGEIRVDADADFVVWEPDTPVAIGPAMLHSQHKVSVWEPQPTDEHPRAFAGRVRATYLRGRKVYSDGRFHAWANAPQGGSGGSGEVLHPELGVLDSLAE